MTAISTYFLTKELWSPGAGLFACCFIAIVPGYISRSVAGSYDNEGIAIFALQFTYYLWVSNCVIRYFCVVIKQITLMKTHFISFCCFFGVYLCLFLFSDNVSEMHRYLRPKKIPIFQTIDSLTFMALTCSSLTTY